MNNVIQEMLNRYGVNNLAAKKDAMKEVLQEIVLCGLSRSVFTLLVKNWIMMPDRYS